MKLRFNVKSSVFAAIAMASGLIVLLGYFFDALAGFRLALLQGVVVLTAVMLLVGIVNLARAHWRKVKTQQKGAVNSLVLLVSMILTLIVVGFSVGYFGPDHEYSLWMYEYIQVPVEASLMAVLAIVLVYAVARMLSRRIDIFTLIFIGTLLLVLIATISLPFIDLPELREQISRAAQVLSSAGARGILLGVALGTVATGLRILMGSDRPYGD